MNKLGKQYLNENFTNYNDVKTKTINWCSKMQSEGLLTPEQFDDCAATFKDIKSGILPKEFKVPSTGMDRNYSLYNTRSEKLTPKVTDENTNTVMLLTNTGEYMACNSNNELYFVRNSDDSTLKQQELYFTLIPQNNDVYAIMSPYGKYLISNTEWGASFSGTSIGNMSSWNISKLDTKVILESVQFSGFYLSFNNSSEPLKIIYGKNDSIQWLMIPKKETQVNNKYGEYAGVEYIVTKENILTTLKNFKIDHLALKNIKNAAETLKINITNSYDNIETYMKNKLDYDKKLFNLTTIDYETQIESINNNSYIDSNLKSQVINGLPKPVGINLPEQEINEVLFNILNRRNYYLQLIQEEISKIDTKLINIEKDIETTIIDYNRFILDIQNELANSKKNIEQNNLIMGRQQDNYEKIDKDVAYFSYKQNKYETLDEKLKVNLEIVDGYKQQSSLLVKIYPIVIVILLLLLIYLIYLTSIKFMDNIYNKY